MSTLKTTPLPPSIDAPSHRDSTFNQFSAWIAWLVAALFLFYQIAIQTSFGSMQSPIQKDLGLTAEDLSTISAVFFITYAGMQIPAGALLDRFGAGWVLPPAILLVGLGGFLLSIADSLFVASMARLIMGAAGAFSFLGVTAVTNRRIAPRQIGLATGLIEVTFGVGAILGSLGVAALLVSVSWRTGLQIFAAASILIALLNLIFLGRGGQFTPYKPTNQQSFGRLILEVLSDLRTWKIGLVFGAFTGTMFGMSGFWNTPLQEAFDRTPKQAALLTTAMFIGTIVGAPIVGWLADRLQRYLPFIGLGCILLLVSLIPTIYVTWIAPGWLVMTMFFVLGLGIATSLMVFPLACRDMSRSKAGMTCALVNCLGLLAAGTFQWVPGVIQARIPETGIWSIQISMLIFVLWPAIALVIVIHLALKQRKLLRNRQESAVAIEIPESTG